MGKSAFGHVYSLAMYRSYTRSFKEIKRLIVFRTILLLVSELDNTSAISSSSETVLQTLQQLFSEYSLHEL